MSVYFQSLVNLIGRVVYRYSNRLGCRMPCALQVLGWVSENWDPLKGMRRLPRVDLFESGRDNFIGIRALVFKWFLVVLSPVDISNYNLLRSDRLNLNFWILNIYFLFVVWIHHHYHDEDEVDLKRSSRWRGCFGISQFSITIWDSSLTVI